MRACTTAISAYVKVNGHPPSIECMVCCENVARPFTDLVDQDSNAIDGCGNPKSIEIRSWIGRYCDGR
jgi:hypothetical protein